MEIDSSASQAILDEMLSQNYSIQQVYRVLQQLAGNRQLVDKSPTYAMSRETLARAEQLFEGAKYIYLTRHPYAAIESFARMRMDKLINSQNSHPYQVAEEIWSTTNGTLTLFRAKKGGKPCQTASLPRRGFLTSNLVIFRG